MSRPSAVAVVSVLAVLAVAPGLDGCGTDTGASAVAQDATASASSPVASATPGTPPTTAITPETLAGYRALSASVNGFFAAVQRAEDEHPEARPRNADEIKSLVGYRFPHGVDLVAYADDSMRICFVGPDDTHLVFTSSADHLRQLLGTGGCRYDDGDVVVDITFDFQDDEQGDPVTLYRHHVVKGADVADLIPGLHDYLDLLNSAM